MSHLLAVLNEWLQDHGLIGVFVFMFVENVGVPFPTELGFIAAQGMVEAGWVPFWLAFVVICAGHVSGAGVSYYVGRAGDNALVRRFSHSRRMMRARDRMQGWYARYGPLALLFGRLVGQVRPWSSLLAGAAGVPPRQFWIWTVVGSVLYTGVTLWLTRWGWALWETHPRYRVPAVIILVTIFYGSLGWAFLARVVQQWLRRRRAQSNPQSASP